MAPLSFSKHEKNMEMLDDSQINVVEALHHIAIWD